MAGRDKRRKIRVDLYKNRENRARLQNLTRRVEEEADAVDQMQLDERLSGKGRLTRRRTVIAVENESGDVVIDVNKSQCSRGRVLSAIGANNCRVEDLGGRMFNCTIRQVVRAMSRDARNAVVAGDEVLFTPGGGDAGVIERVEPRRSTLSRGTGRHAHVITANIDQSVIVGSVADPQLKVPLIDRFICSALAGNVRPIICLNKIDLVDPVELQPIVGMYARLGYPIIPTSAATGEGIDELRSHLHGKESVFTGQSGVGKSSLLNAIDPSLTRSTSDVSVESRKGKHTTRVAELQRIEGGGWVVDTPGIRQLQLWDILSEQIEGYFIEFAPFVAQCKFSNCSHVHETGCGVREALNRHMLSPLRYQSYVRLATGDADEDEK